MNEIKITNYALLVTLIITMGIFCTSINSITNTNKDINNTKTIVYYEK